MWPNDLTIEELTEEAMGLLALDLDELYAVLGWQVLASRRPARVAGIMAHLAAGSKGREAGSFAGRPSIDVGVSDWEKEFESIHADLRREALVFLGSVSADLRTGLCNEDVLALSDHINRSSMQIIVMIIGAVLKIPSQIESVSATLAAIVCKSGLRDFCR